MGAIAESQAKAGDTQAARQSLAAARSALTIIDEKEDRVGLRLEAIADRVSLVFTLLAERQAKAGDFSGISETLAFIRFDRVLLLPKIATALVEPAQTDPSAREKFMLLLPECAPYFEAALSMSGHLATLFPASATAIANIIMQLPAD